jgi:hypothetical protein
LAIGMLYAVINRFFNGTYGGDNFKRTLEIFKDYYDKGGKEYFLF